MRSRKVRVPAVGVWARLGPGSGELVNVSHSGALVQLDHEVAVGSSGSLRMSEVEVGCHVVRCALASPPGPLGPRRWLIAVVFADHPPDTAKALRKLVAEMHNRTAASRA